MLHLQVNALSSPEIAHGFFGRSGGVSEGIFSSLNCGPGSGDDRQRVVENRRRALAPLAGATRADLVTLYQVHSAQTVTVMTPWGIGEGPRADGMATNLPGLALGILTADCAPVLLADAKAKVIGAAHAGWQGALAGILEATIGTMEALGAERAKIVAAVGPCIDQTNYEIGPEFLARFLAQGEHNARWFVPSDKPRHHRFDLAGYVVGRLAVAGITRVETIPACTYGREDEFFSFRRASHRGEKGYGRQLSAILLAR
ncbi:MAG: peptidoglycan editing factor PgeF [Alphaproteobacteria bacterium]|jgi:YfiH family protein